MKTEKINFVSAYTINTPYEQEVENLKKSLIKFEFSIEHIIPINNLGTWEKNCQQKATVIKNKLTELNEPIVWLDADAVINKYPELFGRIQKDLAICVYKNEYLSGTIFLKPSKQIFDLLDEWIQECINNPKEWDQKILQKLILDKKINHFILPPSYCKVDFFESDDNIISQNQASRRFKKIINKSNQLNIINNQNMDPYATHLEALVYATLMNNENILELGCGYYSTPLLYSICKIQNRKLSILSSNKDWLDKFKDYGECELVENWSEFNFHGKYGMVFLDNEQLTAHRIMLIPKIMQITNVLVVHDADKMINNPNWKNFTEQYNQIWFKKYNPHTVILLNS
jgi:hypothetical protein